MIIGCPRCHIFTSVPQVVAASIRTSTSPGPGTGSGTSRTRRSSSPNSSAALTAPPRPCTRSPSRWAASAAPVSASGNRLPISSATRVCPPRRSASDARMSAGPADQLAVTRNSRANTVQPSISSGEPGSGGAYRHSEPPGASAWAASAIACGCSVHTIATSTGSLPCAVAPQSSAAASRSGSGSRTHTASTPRACAAAMCSMPLQPAPTTSRLSPGRIPARSCARSAQPSGSVSVATTGSTPSSGSSSPTSSGWMRTYSANPPGSSAVARNCSHSVSWPCRQRRHSPHGAWWWIATRSPTATPTTSAPTSTTSPTGSWPSTAGSLRSTYQPTSEPHVAHASTRQTTSPGPQTGSGRSSIRVSSTATVSATFTPPSPGCRRSPAARSRAR